LPKSQTVFPKSQTVFPKSQTVLPKPQAVLPKPQEGGNGSESQHFLGCVFVRTALQQPSAFRLTMLFPNVHVYKGRAVARQDGRGHQMAAGDPSTQKASLCRY
jgi:hypothetical protein